MKVYLFASSICSIHKGLFVKGQPWKRVQFPFLSAVIEYNGDLILLDTGIGTRMDQEFKNPKYKANAWFHKSVMKAVCDPGRDPLIHQMQAIGLDPAAVKYGILSHLHYDHAGGMRDFPNAKYFINKKEWEAATSADSHKHSYIREQYEVKPKLNIELISTVPGKSYLGFPASLDLFGDGRFILVDLPGHSDGLTGVFVNLPSGRRFLFPGDSVYFPENLEGPAPKSWLMQKLVHEKPLAFETLKTLHNLAKAEPDLEIVSFHDHRIPGKYELAPVYYE